MKHQIKIKLVKIKTITGILLLMFIFSSCDFSVQNPGPVEDEQLNDPIAFPTIVNGMKKSFAKAQNTVAFLGSIVTKQITGAGSISTFGSSPNERIGRLLSSEVHVNEGWNYAQQARWLAEDGTRRIREQLGGEFSSSRYGAEALIWSGYANRLLGNNMCTCIIDGGAPQENVVYFQRAEDNFSEAIKILEELNDSELINAAYAGRASVRVLLNKWEGAVDDARNVPMDFVFVSQRSNIKTSEYNYYYWANANQPYRSYSVVDTYYEDYYEEYNDPRVSWDTDPELPYVSTVEGEIEWLFQTKYVSNSSPINLSSGDEMILIRAEAMLRSGDWQEALKLVNSIRKKNNVKLWQASNEKEAWTRLKRERGIELWMEGRRLADLRRWTKEKIPGKMEDMTDRDLCFPIGQDEKENNSNL